MRNRATLKLSLHSKGRITKAPVGYYGNSYDRSGAQWGRTAEAMHHVTGGWSAPVKPWLTSSCTGVDKRASHDRRSFSDPPRTMTDNQVLTEEQVMNGFHAFLVSALRHAKVERLLTDELLASAEADLMICGKSWRISFLHATNSLFQVPHCAYTLRLSVLTRTLLEYLSLARGAAKSPRSASLPPPVRPGSFLSSNFGREQCRAFNPSPQNTPSTSLA